MPFLPFLHAVVSGADLSSADAYDAMTILLEGGASEAQIAGLLVALKLKGETADELAGFARAMRDKMIRVEAGSDLIDTAGTGGDGSGTFNISTVAAFVMTGAGARVAKHGNRSLSSSSGSADLLEALGVRIAVTAQEAASSIREIGIGFLFAPNLHPAMRYAQPVRRDLKLRTAFNLLGPLCNPARACHQLIGAPSPEAAELMANTLLALGTARSFVVHGQDGLDEVSTTGPTDVWEVTATGLTRHLWMPSDFGLPRARMSELQGGDPVRNAEITQEILAGVPGPARDIVVANAAAGLFAAGIALSLWQAVDHAQRSLDTGQARAKLELLQKRFPIS